MCGRASLTVDPQELREAFGLTDVGLEHAEFIMANVPAGRSPGTRRHVAQVVRRILALAVYPGRHLSANPIPRGARATARLR